MRPSSAGLERRLGSSSEESPWDLRAETGRLIIDPPASSAT